MVRRGAGPQKLLELVDASAASEQAAVSFGAGHLLRLAKRLLSDGWRVREIDLRDFFLEVPDDENVDSAKTTLRQVLQSSDDDYLSEVASQLPYVISSIRLARGAIGESSYWAKFYRMGRIDSGTVAATGDVDSEYLRRVIQQAWAGD